jgi:hypothetical protein
LDPGITVFHAVDIPVLADTQFPVGPVGFLQRARACGARAGQKSPRKHESRIVDLIVQVTLKVRHQAVERLKCRCTTPDGSGPTGLPQPGVLFFEPLKYTPHDALVVRKV